jgi:hypothetical protein
MHTDTKCEVITSTKEKQHTKGSRTSVVSKALLSFFCHLASADSVVSIFKPIPSVAMLTYCKDRIANILHLYNTLAKAKDDELLHLSTQRERVVE